MRADGHRGGDSVSSVGSLRSGQGAAGHDYGAAVRPPPLVAVIHATPASLEPAGEAFAQTLPGARVWNILDDQLLGLVDASGGLTPVLAARMTRLLDHALAGGADAVLLACSVYGPVAKERAVGLATPLLTSDEAMFDAVADLHPRRVVVLGTTAVTAADTADRLRAHLGGTRVQVDAVVVSGGYAAAVGGDRRVLEDAVVRQAEQVAGDVDVVVIAQFSLSPAARAAGAAVQAHVLSAPHLAAAALGRRLRRTP